MTFRRLSCTSVNAVTLTRVDPCAREDRANQENAGQISPLSDRHNLPWSIFDEARIQQPTFYKFPFVGAVK
jgi:hypothetical protein